MTYQLWPELKKISLENSLIKWKSHLRAVVRFEVEWVTDDPLQRFLDALLDELVVDFTVNVDPSPCAAALAHVEESAHMSAFNGQIQVAVVHDDVRRFASQLEGDFFQICLAGCLLNEFTDLQIEFFQIFLEASPT